MGSNATQNGNEYIARARRWRWHIRPKDSPTAIIMDWLGVSARNAELIRIDLETCGYDLDEIGREARLRAAHDIYYMLEQEGLLE